MFERFTDRARHIIVYAQDEARLLRHNYIGTEHLLLAILRDDDGIAARVLMSFGLSRDTARDEVTKEIGLGKAQPKGHIPFTPRSKKVLELSLRESRNLHHEFIGTEHLLLGLLREGGGVGAKIISAQCGDLETVRQAVLDALPEQGRTRRWPRRASASMAFPMEGGGFRRTTPAFDATLNEAVRLAAPGSLGSHHLLLAALADPDAAAARVLAHLGLDLDQARAALRDADVIGTSDEQPEESGRRQMIIHTAGDGLTIEVTDPAIVQLGLAATEALGERAGSAGVIPGDLPASASLASVWIALRESLEDIRRRALAANGGAADLAQSAGSGSEDVA